MNKQKRWAALVLALLMLVNMTVASVAYSDSEASTHWAAEAVNNATEKEYFKNDVWTQLDSNMTRADFVLLLQNIFDYPVAQHEFKDVDSSADYSAAVGALANAGIVNGRTKDAFFPGDPLTRQEAATLISRAYSVLDTASDAASDYIDSDSISDWAYEAVSAMTQAGYINGFPNGTFGPLGYFTYAQAAQLIYNIELSNILLPEPETPQGNAPDPGNSGSSSGENASEPSPRGDYIDRESTGVVNLLGSRYLYFALQSQVSLSGMQVSVNGQVISGESIVPCDKAGNIFKIALSTDSASYTLALENSNGKDSFIVTHGFTDALQDEYRYIVGDMVVAAKDYTAAQYNKEGLLIYFPSDFFDGATVKASLLYDAISGASLVIPPVDETGSGNDNDYTIRKDFIFDADLLSSALILNELGYEGDGLELFLSRWESFAAKFAITSDAEGYSVVPIANATVIPSAVKFVLENGMFGGLLSLDELVGKHAPELSVENINRTMNPIEVTLSFEADDEWSENITAVYVDDKPLDSENVSVSSGSINIQIPIVYFATHKISVLADGYAATRVDVVIAKTDAIATLQSEEITQGEDLVLTGVDSAFYSNIELLKINDRWLTKGTDYIIVGDKIKIAYNAQNMQLGENSISIKMFNGYQDFAGSFTIAEGTPVETEKGEVPTLSLDGNAYKNEKAVILLSEENSVWKDSITAVKLKGSVETNIANSIDLSNDGKLIIKAEAYLKLGNYTLTVEADGYENATLSFTVRTRTPAIAGSFDESGNYVITADFNFIYDLKGVMIDDVSITGYAKTSTKLTIPSGQFTSGAAHTIELVMDTSSYSYYYENYAVTVTAPVIDTPDPDTGDEISIALAGEAKKNKAITFDLQNATQDWKNSLTGISLVREGASHGVLIGNGIDDCSFNSDLSQMSIGAYTVNVAGNYTLTITASGYDDVVLVFTVVM